MKGQLGGRFNAPPGGMGRMGGKGLGPGGYCVCSQCGYSILHSWASPCYDSRCPRCGSILTRE